MQNGIRVAALDGSRYQNKLAPTLTSSPSLAPSCLAPPHHHTISSKPSLSSNIAERRQLVTFSSPLQNHEARLGSSRSQGGRQSCPGESCASAYTLSLFSHIIIVISPRIHPSHWLKAWQEHQASRSINQCASSPASAARLLPRAWTRKH